MVEHSTVGRGKRGKQNRGFLYRNSHHSLSPYGTLYHLARLRFRKDHCSRKEHHGLGSSGSILTPTRRRYKASLQATVLVTNMPSENPLPNVPIPLPLALYVIPLAIMAEYLAQQLWAFVRRSLETDDTLEAEEDISPPPSSPSPSPPSSSSEEENSSVAAYATPASSPSPILPVRMLDKGKKREEAPPLTPPAQTVTSLPCLVCRFENHTLTDCLEFRKIPTVVVKDFSLSCVLCGEVGHQPYGCPQYHCPICLQPAPGHSNNSCPNSPVDPSSEEE